MAAVTLPTASGGTAVLTLAPAKSYPVDPTRFSRRAYAAAHVVADPLADVDPWLEPAIDWDRTLAFREHLWDLGLGVAEAMDTAQRGMGLTWEPALELIRRSVAAQKARGDGTLLGCGVGTDQLAPSPDLSLDAVIAAYEEQCEAVERLGGRIILMASKALAACARSTDDYGIVYDRLLSQVAEPVIIHWLGEMFDPALAGYWGADDHMQAMEVCLDILSRNTAKVDGIKISLLSAEKEIAMRRRLPDGVVMYTGDDFNYPDLIEGDDRGHSEALLGIFDPIAPLAAAALTALGANDRARYHAIFDPTIALSRHVFKAPTRFYKTGVVFLAYLNGFQDHFTMVGGQESARSTLHLAELVRLADAAGALADPDLAAARARLVFATRGVDA
jgi:hypothetical protein